MKTIKRSGGVLMPVWALPSPYGMGDFGPAAFAFVDWLHQAGQSWWQVLPLTIPDSVGSPYFSPSSQAGNWLHISPDVLRRQGLLKRSDMPDRVPIERVNYQSVRRQWWTMLYRSFLYAQEQPSKVDAPLKTFKRREHGWLQEYVLYQALKDHHGGQPWWLWPKKYQSYHSARQHPNPKIAQRMAMHEYVQWLFDQQWSAVKDYAHHKHIRIIGDLPFFEPLDSVDVWSRPELFHLNKHRRPVTVAGVPPDYFNTHGQKWGNPVYAWSTHRQTKYQWWVDRLAKAWQRYDLIRIDHFRGLVATWHIPAKANDGRRGRWVATPGKEILRRVLSSARSGSLLAEDLGAFSPLVDKLRQRFAIPGMRVLLFGWSGLPENVHQPDHISADNFVYTSTHDTNTVMGWWQQEAKNYERQDVQKFLGPLSSRPVSWAMIEGAYGTPATVAIVPVTDILSMDQSARLNRPGTKRGNWSWRLTSGHLSVTVARRLKVLAKRHHR